MNLTIILPSGVFENTNQQYRKYLDRASEILHKIGTDILFLPGGFTNPQKKISEAESLSDYFQSLDLSLGQKILKEEESLTTPQNLEFIRDLIKDKKLKPDKIFVICDSIRIPKVYILSLMCFKELMGLEITEEEMYLSFLRQGLEINANILGECEFNYQNITIRGLALERSKEEIVVQISSAMLEVNHFKYPKIDEMIVAWRKKKFGIK